MDAICQGNRDAVKKLLPLIDPSTLNDRLNIYGSDTLLTRALKHPSQFSDIAHMLIDAGVDVNKPNVHGLVPLALAIKKIPSLTSPKDPLLLKQLFLTASLIKSGSDVNKPEVENSEYFKEFRKRWDESPSYTAKRRTPLMYAVNNIPLCCWLMKQGADPKIKDINGLDAADHCEKQLTLFSSLDNRIDYEKFIEVLRNPQDLKHAKFIDKKAAYIEKIMKDTHARSKYQYVRNRELGRNISKARRTIGDE
jgi:hypothetical protein